MATEKYPIHSVRLDDEVWRALKARPESLNQILRRALNLDRPVALSARDLALRHTENSERGKPRFDAAEAKSIMEEKIPPRSPEGRLRKALQRQEAAAERSFKGPLLKPKDRKKGAE